MNHGLTDLHARAASSRATEFDPDRWLPGGSAAALSKNDSYWPFGGGPRNCIGMGFALMELSLVRTLLRSVTKAMKDR